MAGQVHKRAKILDVLRMASMQDMMEQEGELQEFQVQQKSRWQKCVGTWDKAVL
jgi:hypothetical protein